MIDWVTLRAPLAHDASRSGPLWNGEVLSIRPDPELGEAIDWTVAKRLQLKGSYDATIQVRSCELRVGEASTFNQGIEVSGNLCKWFQGHNVFGTNDAHGLVVEGLVRICSLIGVTPTPAELNAWSAGFVQLLRVDVTESYDLGSTPRVRNALRALDATGNLRHRGRGHFYGDSIVYGKGSRRYSITLYAKGPEIEKHPLPLDLAESSVGAVAKGLLRAEVRMMSMQLKRDGLDWLCAWDDNTATELHHRYVARLDIADSTMVDATIIEGLPPRLALVAQAWQDGHDLRTMLTRPTFYRHRRELLKLAGVDIAIRRDREQASNVVQLRQVITAKPFNVPDWALGTPLYFEPRAKAA